MKTYYSFNRNGCLWHPRFATAGGIDLITKNVSVSGLVDQSRWRVGLFLILLLLGCFAFAPAAQPAARPSPTPGPQDVNVVNTPTVSDADNPARQPFQAYGYEEFIGNLSAYVVITTVPAGKRLIIEHVSVIGSVLTGQKLIRASIGVGNGDVIFHDLPISAQGSEFGGFRDLYIASEQVRLYADPGTQVYYFVARNNYRGSEPEGYTEATISGYLVDVP